MEQHTDLDKLNDTELLEWLEGKSLYGLNRVLAKRLSRLYSAYYRQSNEAHHMRLRLKEKYNDHSF